MMYDSNQQNRLLKVLEKNILFKDIQKEKLESLLKEFKTEIWPKHLCNINSKNTLRRFHIIVSGRLKIFQVDPDSAREFTLFLLQPNDVFDILCLLDGFEHKVYYETLDEVEILSIPIERMREWVKVCPQINGALLPYLGKQLRTLEEYASSHTLSDISSRLTRLILNHINQDSQELELINDLSNEELANLIGSTRAVVNRHLQDLKSDGILRMGRKKMEIQDLQLLQKKAEKKHPGF